MRNKLLSILLILSLVTLTKAQQFLNGSFELVDIDCRFGLPNSGFNAHVEHVKSIGNNEIAGGISLLSEECGTGPAVDGFYYIGLSIDEDFKLRDILSLELSRPMIPGNAYIVEFYLKTGNRGGLRNVLEIGLSNSNEFAQFGEKIHSIKGSTESWELMSFQFIAPIEGKYLTLKLKIGNFGRVLLDNFSVRCPTSLDLGTDTSYCFVENILLEPKGSYETYFWQDRSTDPNFIVQNPGLYWVEAKRDECTVRDSIIISEIEHNCQCQFFVPNAFSPNLDGINDMILPLTDCTLIDYEFQVFSRWGQLLFQSNDPTIGWDGQVKNKLMPIDGYVYQLRYQFSYQDVPQYLSGFFNLVR